MNKLPSINFSVDKQKIVDFIIEDINTTDEDLIIYFKQLINNNCNEKYLNHPTVLEMIDTFSVKNIQLLGLVKTREEQFKECYESIMIYVSLLSLDIQ